MGAAPGRPEQRALDNAGLDEQVVLAEPARADELDDNRRVGERRRVV